MAVVLQEYYSNSRKSGFVRICCTAAVIGRVSAAYNKVYVEVLSRIDLIILKQKIHCVAILDTYHVLRM